MAGLSAGDKEAAAVRGVRVIDDAGQVQGAMAYTLAELPGAFRSEMRIRTMAAATDEALCALWQFVVQHDLVTRASVDLRPLDDPLPWLVADQRAVTAQVHDHGWLRVIDVPQALEGRRYAAPLDLVVRVEDPLGFAAGDWHVLVDDAGRARVTPASTDPTVSMSVVELSAIYAGGVGATALASAGRIRGTAEDVEALTRAFAAQPAPVLGIWY